MKWQRRHRGLQYCYTEVNNLVAMWTNSQQQPSAGCLCWMPNVVVNTVKRGHLKPEKNHLWKHGFHVLSRFAVLDIRRLAPRYVLAHHCSDVPQRVRVCSYRAIGGSGFQQGCAPDA